MEVTREMLMAYADGELDEVTSRRIEQAISDDPDLARQLDADLALKANLRGHFAAIDDEPVPEAWAAMIAGARDEDTRVVELNDARQARARRGVPGWGAGVAIAASLVLGVLLGTQVNTGDGPLIEKDGTILASAYLEKALDTQLAAKPEGARLRMLASFRRDDGGFCRAFTGEALSGIACRAEDGWHLERLLPGSRSQSTQYRQAGSTEAELMAAAQEMASEPPLDTEQEKAARARGWR